MSVRLNSSRPVLAEQGQSILPNPICGSPDGPRNKFNLDDATANQSHRKNREITGGCGLPGSSTMSPRGGAISF